MSKSQPPVVTRFAPSPTGFLHVGSARTALFNYLFTKKHGGTFLLRIEDTDKERSKKEFEDDILAGLSWLGISHDGEPTRQSERTAIYRSYLEKMILSGAAYEAEENQDKTGKVVRFKNPNKTITFHDLIRGDISFDTAELGDFVVAKDKETPLYHLAVVVDDHEMGITHVIRGEDHISNTPRQILIQEAIGAKRPLYAHIPLILAPDRSKLSKRHGAVSVSEYKIIGYLPEAFVNFLALLGWNPGTDKEIFSIEELTAAFDIEKVQKGAAVFNEEKLKWMNREHLRALPHEEIAPMVLERLPEDLRAAAYANLDIGQKVLDRVILERIHVLSEVTALADAGEFSFYFSAPHVAREKIVWKKGTAEKTLAHLDKIASILHTASFESPDTIKRALFPYADKEGRGEVLWPYRYALSGRDTSPDPFTISYVIGKQETIRRIQTARDLL
mgnify:FL=1